MTYKIKKLLAATGFIVLIMLLFSHPVFAQASMLPKVSGPSAGALGSTVDIVIKSVSGTYITGTFIWFNGNLLPVGKGANNQVIVTDGAGSLSWAAQSGAGSPYTTVQDFSGVPAMFFPAAVTNTSFAASYIQATLFSVGGLPNTGPMARIYAPGTGRQLVLDGEGIGSMSGLWFGGISGTRVYANSSGVLVIAVTNTAGTGLIDAITITQSGLESVKNVTGTFGYFDEIKSTAAENERFMQISKLTETWDTTTPLEDGTVYVNRKDDKFVMNNSGVGDVALSFAWTETIVAVSPYSFTNGGDSTIDFPIDSSAHNSGMTVTYVTATFIGGASGVTAVVPITKSWLHIDSGVLSPIDTIAHITNTNTNQASYTAFPAKNEITRSVYLQVGIPEMLTNTKKLVVQFFGWAIK